jgi:hypothetical protein
MCQSVNLAEFTAEMMIHFSGRRNIDHPGIPAFPNVLVCLNCGSSHFTVLENELALLESRTTKSGANASLRGSVENLALRLG